MTEMCTQEADPVLTIHGARCCLLHCGLQGVDIFAKDFLFIPIHDALHWSLIIVCHPGQLARSSRAGTPQPAAAAPGARRKAGGAAAAASSPGQRKRTRGQEQQAPMTPPKEPSPADLLQSSSSSSEADVEVAEVGPGSDEAEEVVQVQPAPAAAGRSGASGRGRGGSKAEALDMFTVPTACILHLDSMSGTCGSGTGLRMGASQFSLC
jgi:Ulp1 family protease